ncbi:hypothetical protein J2045_000342 [Peteryoungia aggregata LMG 23059]|uniref:DUF3429 domain-containing protein n=1 Tax=Peteryoungia aggregata LMG 23059 TaxID=1368425 RepID=A0ABU0G3N9_9HYPH|nr:DUF3429 domain-containing protein [Peteryoungia aggregata]MDQ0419332.1 hypothetical protein [Peteryoungia aggregata LMG 23059]
MYRAPSLSKLLTYAGALPFWLLALAILAGHLPALAAQAFIAYGTGIACFMAGTVWSQAQARTQDPRPMLVLSNVAALVSIGALLLYPHAPGIALALHIAVYLILLAADLRLHSSGSQPAWYMTLRRNVTLLVITAYALVLILT